MNAAAHWLALGQGLGASAQALFAAPVLGWAEAWQRPWSADPGAQLEGMIRQALGGAAGPVDARSGPVPTEADPQSAPRPRAVPPWPSRDSPRPVAAPLPGMAQRRAQRMAAAVPVAATQPRPGTTGSRADGPADRLVPSHRPALPDGATTRLPLRSPDGAMAAAWNAPRHGRRPPVASDGRAPVRPVAEAVGAVPGSPASARILDWPAMPRAAAPVLAAPVEPVLRGPAWPGVRRDPDAAVPVVSTPRDAAAASGPPADAAALPGPVAPAAASPRLVEGLPALQGLMQQAVDHSLARHAGAMPVAAAAMAPATADAGVDTTPAPAALPPRPAALDAQQPLPARSGFAAVWPELDAQAEEILVDRLADRLNERLRDDALRHFGFTGGLV